MSDFDTILAEKQAAEAFDEWRREQKKKLPNLAKRVFALRNKFHAGCGFHYSMEGQLGSVIKELNSVEPRYYHGKPGDVLGARIVLEVIVEGLFKDVKEAEASARKLAKRRK